MVRCRAPLALIAFLASCSVSPHDDPEGHTTTSPGSTSTSSQTTPGDSSTDAWNDDTSVDDPDLPPQPIACNVWQQDCAENEKCVPYASTGIAWDGNRCVPILGDGQLGDPCISGGRIESTDDCGPGLMCWMAFAVDDQLIGQCTSLCQGDPDEPTCPSQGDHCLSNGGFDWFSGQPAVCGITCDPLLQDCPAEEIACGLDPGGTFSCYTTLDVPRGQPCESFDACEKAHLCIPGDLLPSCAGDKCCTEFCDPQEPGSVCLTPGTECIKFYDEGLPLAINPGVCVVPQ